MAKEQPTWTKELGWTCPEGFAHPKCPTCGHNFYECKPEPVNKDGTANRSGICEWCWGEANT